MKKKLFYTIFLMSISNFIFHLCFPAIALASGSVSGQSLNEVRLGITAKNITLKEAFELIKENTNFKFFYMQGDIDDSRRIDLDLQKKSLREGLQEIANEERLDFKRINDLIVVKKSVSKNPVVSEEDATMDQEVKGHVKDGETDQPLPGVNIILKGSDKGTTTDIDGNYRINVPDGSRLIYSYIGFQTQEIEVGNKSVIDVVLKPDLSSLSEIVVTAMSIERENSTIGYSVQEVEGEVFEKASDPNLINSLAGKVAGLYINTSSELFNNSQISLRGEEPIIIVDGVSTDIKYWELNHNDIENISVLKGATAAALYGSEGRNGAIIITTKKGSANKTRVEFNSTTLWQPWLLAYPETQTEFGSGNNGVYEYVDGTGSGIEGGGFTWGPKLDGRLLPQWNSPIDPETGERIPIPWEDKTDGKGNLRTFLETGYTFTNNINIETGNDKGTFRASLSHNHQKGVVPNTKLNVTGFNLGGSYNLTDRIKINTSLNYSRQYSPNYRIPSYGPHDYIYSLAFWLGADIDLEDAKNYWVEGKENIQQRFQQLGYYNNPYLLSYENLHSWDKNVVYGQVTGTYTIIPETMNLLIRSGFNSNSLEETERVPKSMTYYGEKSRGDFIVDNTQFFRINTDVMLTFNKKLNNFLEFDGLLGFSQIYEKNTWLNSRTDGLSIPGLFTLENSMNPVVNSNNIEESQICGVYANLNLRIWRPFYLSLTTRNDWVSTLPVNNNSFLYPSASLSYVISDMIQMPDLIDILRVRASWAQVNSGWTGSTYGHIQTYDIGTYYNYPTMSLGSVLLPDDLQPSGSRTVELGGNIGILGNRINLDFSYYKKLEYDNIIAKDISLATGFTSIKGNGRDYERKGFEIILVAKPVRTQNVNWDINFNWSQSHHFLKSLEDGKERDGYIKLDTRTDQIYKRSWMRSPDGQIVYDVATGLPVRDEYNRYVGNFDPDFYFGLQNSISYKNFSFQFSIDGQVGGRYYSILPRMGRAGTATNYDSQLREDAANGLKNYVADGVVVAGGEVEYDFEGNIISDTRTFAPNTTATSYQDWSKAIYNLSNGYAETYLDATFLKLRDISISYDFPANLLDRTFFTSARLSLIGNNVLLITKKEAKGDDPSWRNDNLKSPTPVNLGFNLNLKF